MTDSSSRKWQVFVDVLQLAVPTLAAFLFVRQVLSHLQGVDGEYRLEDETRKNTAMAAKEKIQSILSGREEEGPSEHSYGRDRPPHSDLRLTQYEQIIAMELVKPADIPVSFQDIGGLEDTIEELKESVIYPLTLPHLYLHSSSLLSAPPGVLLHGPPGCGKTMLAKALAHDSGACFINLHISTLTEKWYGDSNKLVRAVFSLARKLQPTIVFIDEIDAVLGQRRSGEHEASGMVKAEFMTHWDGLASADSVGGSQRICILGATNRIHDIDEAILRRMPKRFSVPLPSPRQRQGIFELVLKDTKLDEKDFDLDYLVHLSEGMSGSDIKELCRDAAMCPMREFIKGKKAAGTLRDLSDPRDMRGIRTGDFISRKLSPTEPAEDMAVRGQNPATNLSGSKVQEEEVWRDDGSDITGNG